MSGDDILALDVFVTGVPAGVNFNDNTDKLLYIINKLDIATDVCYIGLLAYFEIFCKDHFASLVNICSPLLVQFKQKGHDVSLDSTDLLSLNNLSQHQIGFLIAERYDFGSAQKINSYYNSLILITPFSKEEKTRYDKMLNNRNILVHHGGVYTMAYAKQSQNPNALKEVFRNPVPISKEDLELSISFLKDMAKKIMISSQKAIRKHIESQAITMSSEIDKAIDFLTLWDVTDQENAYV